MPSTSKKLMIFCKVQGTSQKIPEIVTDYYPEFLFPLHSSSTAAARTARRTGPTACTTSSPTTTRPRSASPASGRPTWRLRRPPSASPGPAAGTPTAAPATPPSPPSATGGSPPRRSGTRWGRDLSLPRKEGRAVADHTVLVFSSVKVKFLCQMTKNVFIGHPCTQGCLLCHVWTCHVWYCSMVKDQKYFCSSFWHTL